MGQMFGGLSSRTTTAVVNPSSCHAETNGFLNSAQTIVGIHKADIVR